MTEEEKESKVVYEGDTFGKEMMPEGGHDLGFAFVISLVKGEEYAESDLARAQTEATHYRKVFKVTEWEHQFYRYQAEDTAT